MINEYSTLLYMRITDCCNVKCPFCLAYSSPRNNNYMSFTNFQNIVAKYHNLGDYAIQLEGGEPLLHPEFLKMVKHCCADPRCRIIRIATNAILLNEVVRSLALLAASYKKIIFVKISINYFLEETIQDRLNILETLLKPYVNSEFLKFKWSIYLRHPKELDSFFLNELNSSVILSQFPRYVGNLVFCGRGLENKVSNLTVEPRCWKSPDLRLIFITPDGQEFEDDKEFNSYSRNLADDPL